MPQKERKHDNEMPRRRLKAPRPATSELDRRAEDIQQRFPEIQQMEGNARLEFLVERGVLDCVLLAHLSEKKQLYFKACGKAYGSKRHRSNDGTLIHRMRIALLESPREHGILSTEDLLMRLGLGATHAYNFAAEYRVPYPSDLQPYPCWPEVDNLLGKAPTNQVAKSVRVSRQYLYKYIAATNQKGVIRERRAVLARETERRRDEQEQEQTARRQLLAQGATALRGHVLAGAEREGGMPLRKAYEYDAVRRKSNLPAWPIEKLQGLFDAYYATVNQGLPVSFSEIGRSMGTGTQSVSYICRRVGLGSSYAARSSSISRGRLLGSKWKREAANRATKTPFARVDVARILGTGRFAFRTLPFQTTHIPTIGRFGYQGEIRPPRYVGYADAMDVYEARSLHYTLGETAEVLGMPRQAVISVLDRRNELEPIIVNALRTMFDDTGISKPYLPDCIRERLRGESDRPKG